MRVAPVTVVIAVVVQASGVTAGAPSTCTASHRCVVTLATTASDSRAIPRAVAVDGTHVYWANLDGVWRVPANGGLAGGAVRSIAPATNSPSMLAMAVDGNALYWSDGHDVMRLPYAGGATERMSTPNLQVTELAADGTNVYAIANGNLYSRPLRGTAWAVLASGTEVESKAVADGGNVYWLNPRRGTVVKVSATGGPVSVLATGSRPSSIAVDATTVYFTDAVDGTVVRVTPK